ncbi:MAG: fimbria/pilus periplasmic chaperone [Candidatus Dasytiphilus stammeri]
MFLLKKIIFILFSIILSFHCSVKATSVLIWPIDPVIEFSQNSTQLWVENLDQNHPIILQMRIFKWQQFKNQNIMLKQNELVASPPIAKILPRQKQLIRLVKIINPPQEKEWAYRLIIDEIPNIIEKNTKKLNTELALKFQMRYSIPLFSDGLNIWTKPNYQLQSDITKATKPQLSYRIIQDRSTQHWLVIKNNGPVHAKIIQLKFCDSNLESWGRKELLGYILPGSAMYLPITVLPIPKWKLIAKVNYNPQFQIVNPL